MEEIMIEPQPINAGQRVRIRYNGLLAKSGANQVFLHAGFSAENQWNNVQDLEMRYEDNAWTTDFKVKNYDKLNICFKDSANNWDNNNGFNWSYAIL